MLTHTFKKDNNLLILLVNLVEKQQKGDLNNYLRFVFEKIENHDSPIFF